MLDGTGSFPALKPDEQRHTPSRPTHSIVRRGVEGQSSPATGGVDLAEAMLSDPSAAEIAALHSRRGGGLFFVGLLVLGALVVGALAFKKQGLELLDELSQGPDAGPTIAPDDLTYEVMLQRARALYEAKKLEDARSFVDTVLDHQPDNAKALALRVDILTAGNALDEADKTLARLKALLVLHPAPTLLARVDDQAKAIADKRAVVPPPKKEPPPTTPPPKSRPKRPSELSSKAFADVTGATKNAISACYVDKVQRKDPRAAGEVALRVHVQPSGEVDDVDITRAPPGPFSGKDFARCVTEQVKKWRFPAFTGDPDVFNYKFAFKPGS